MITIIHGDDISSSRRYFIEQKEKSKNHIDIEGDKINLSDLAQVIGGESLFGEQKDVFIENLLSSKKSKDAKSTVDSLKDNHKHLNIFLWEKQELTVSNTSFFKDAILKKFTLPKSLFAFLDSLKPNNSNVSVKLFHETLKSSKEEIIFFMLIRQFRLLIALLEQDSEQIDEVKRMAPWQKQKLINQSKLFGPIILKQAYQDLFKLDLGIKTGSGIFTLIPAIDFFLLSL
ncbi:hypothetical protein KKG52_02300 [Patescibacteria group bacterium]|nr:hypothetical protein [Patescibacteria group bacterium]